MRVTSEELASNALPDSSFTYEGVAGIRQKRVAYADLASVAPFPVYTLGVSYQNFVLRFRPTTSDPTRPALRPRRCRHPLLFAPRTAEHANRERDAWSALHLVERHRGVHTALSEANTAANTEASTSAPFCHPRAPNGCPDLANLCSRRLGNRITAQCVPPNACRGGTRFRTCRTSNPQRAEARGSKPWRHNHRRLMSTKSLPPNQCRRPNPAVVVPPTRDIARGSKPGPGVSTTRASGFTLAHLLAHAREALIPQLVRAHILGLARWRVGALASPMRAGALRRQQHQRSRRGAARPCGRRPAPHDRTLSGRWRASRVRPAVRPAPRP